MGGFAEGFWWGEDVDFWGRIVFSYPIAFTQRFGAIYHTEIAHKACTRLQPVPRTPSSPQHGVRSNAG